MAMKDRQEDLSVKANQKVFGQMAEIFSQLKKGSLKIEHLQALIEHKNPFPLHDYANLDFALDLFNGKVVTEEESCKVWGLHEALSQKLFYSKATLRRCIKQNDEHCADWWLVYCHGLSLLEQRKVLGTKPSSKLPYFEDDNRWTFKRDEKWTSYKPQAGYYLINFSGQMARGLYCKPFDFDQMEHIIYYLKDKHCHEAIFAEAVLVIFMLRGVNIFSKKWHYGTSNDSFHLRVLVGDFSEGRFRVSPGWPGDLGHEVSIAETIKWEV